MCILQVGPSMGPNPVTGKGIRLAAFTREQTEVKCS